MEKKTARHDSRDAIILYSEFGYMCLAIKAPSPGSDEQECNIYITMKICNVFINEPCTAVLTTTEYIVSLASSTLR